MTETMQDEETVIISDIGLADHEEINISRSKIYLQNPYQRKADLAAFDREKFY